MAPLVRRTWAPRGCTPVFRQKTRAHDKVTMVAALSVSPVRRKVGLYFSLRCDENLNRAWLLACLKDLKRHFRGRLILVWDRLAVHRAKVVHRCIEESRRMRVELLPPYAPELNPVEGLWSHLKLNGLANWAPETSGQLFLEAVAQVEKIERRQDLLCSFVRRTPLSSCLD